MQWSWVNGSMAVTHDPLTHFHLWTLSLTLCLQWYNLSAAMRVVTARVCSHAWLVRPRNKCVKPRSIEWDKFDNTHLSHSRPWFNIRFISDVDVRFWPWLWAQNPGLVASRVIFTAQCYAERGIVTASCLIAPWFCSFRLWRYINHLLTYLLTVCLWRWGNVTIVVI